MQVIHCPTPGEERVLADRVRVADGTIAKARGLVLAAPLEAGEAVVFRFRRAGRRRVHTLFVREALDVVWAHYEEVEAVARIDPWSLGSTATADTIVELPAGAASDVDPGSIVRLDGVDGAGDE